MVGEKKKRKAIKWCEKMRRDKNNKNEKKDRSKKNVKAHLRTY